ncbi:MAG: hypothetical protein ACJ8FS_16540 [Sphingomicrobium sp.]
MRTNLGIEMASAYSSNALRQIASHARMAASVLQDHAKECGTAHLQEAKAHMEDAQDFAQLDALLHQIITAITPKSAAQ